MYVQGDLLLVILAVNTTLFWDTLYVNNLLLFSKYSEVSMVGRYVTSLYLPCKW